ncbi:MAG: 3-hydroxyacyl-ACP dehydratase FabZ family protein [Planctomycetota bacterium]
MATEQLFPLDDLDLSACAVSAEEVGKLNPQAGDMRQIDHVIWMSDDCRRAVGVKQVRDDEFWVAGHIPGRPLLPGVMMIEAAAQLCSVQFWYPIETEEAAFLGFTRCDNVVFRGQVVPGNTLYIIAKQVRVSPRRIVSDAQGIVNGTIVFEARITGMRL